MPIEIQAEYDRLVGKIRFRGYKMACIFCDITHFKADAYFIHSTNNFCCFLDIDPINYGHILSKYCMCTKKHS